MALTITRKRGEKLVIENEKGEKAVIEVMKDKRNLTRLRIDAPPSIQIYREELRIGDKDSPYKTQGGHQK